MRRRAMKVKFHRCNTAGMQMITASRSSSDFCHIAGFLVLLLEKHLRIPNMDASIHHPSRNETIPSTSCFPPSYTGNFGAVIRRKPSKMTVCKALRTRRQRSYRVSTVFKGRGDASSWFRETKLRPYISNLPPWSSSNAPSPRCACPMATSSSRAYPFPPWIRPLYGHHAATGSWSPLISFTIDILRVVIVCLWGL